MLYQPTSSEDRHDRGQVRPAPQHTSLCEAASSAKRPVTCRGFKRDKILDPEDIAETMMLVFTTGANCVPQDLTLRLGLSAM